MLSAYMRVPKSGSAQNPTQTKKWTDTTSSPAIHFTKSMFTFLFDVVSMKISLGFASLHLPSSFDNAERH